MITYVANLSTVELPPHKVMDPPDPAELTNSEFRGTLKDFKFWPGWQQNLDHKVQSYVQQSYKDDKERLASRSDGNDFEEHDDDLQLFMKGGQRDDNSALSQRIKNDRMIEHLEGQCWDNQSNLSAMK